MVNVGLLLLGAVALAFAANKSSSNSSPSTVGEVTNTGVAVTVPTTLPAGMTNADLFNQIMDLRLTAQDPIITIPVSRPSLPPLTAQQVRWNATHPYNPITQGSVLWAATHNHMNQTVASGGADEAAWLVANGYA
jgi:hypothetical protein